MGVSIFLSILGITFSTVGLVLYLRGTKGYLFYEYDINLMSKNLRGINMFIHIMFYISIFLLAISNFTNMLFVPLTLIMIYEYIMKKYITSISFK